MNELSPEARRLLELARNVDDPDARIEARVERNVASRIALGAGAARAAGSGAAAAQGIPQIFAVKALITLGAIGTLGGAAWFCVEHARGAAPAERATPLALPSSVLVSAPVGPVRSNATVAPVAPVAENAAHLATQRAPLAPATAVHSASESPSARSESPSRATAERRLAADGAPTTSKSARSSGGAPASSTQKTTTGAPEPDTASAESPVDSLQAEAAALRSAQHALRSGDARRALELLAQQEAAFRGGVLAEERSAARVLALCQSHERTAARSEAQRFEQRYPDSALLGKVRAACRDQ